MTFTEPIWFIGLILVSAAALLATLRTQRTRLTLEDQRYLRHLIPHEIAQMHGEQQAPYYAGSPTEFDEASSHSAPKP